MAINEFKKIIDTKGYKLDDKDRQIFEREMQKTLFGSSNSSWNISGNTDMIEFVLYDSNENKLPQGDAGDFVRYIYLDDANINKYFLIKPESVTTSGQLNNSAEYLVDTELLIKEAGYANGIFKTQITLLNRRAGSEKIKYDRLWIHEISPSRTEIRVLPVNDDDNVVLPDLQERYNIFVNNGNFRDDTISYVQQFVESIDIQKVFESFLTVKGKVTTGQTYIDLIKQEFKVDAFEIFLDKIKQTFIKSMQFYTENRDWNINSLTYGNPLTTRPSIDLSKDEICTVTSNVLADTIDYTLPRRTILENSSLSLEDQITFDELQDVLNTLTSDTIYDTTLPDTLYSPVRGCMDPNANNFNASATIDDGSCEYNIPIVSTPVYGCTDPASLNFNASATIDDGSCKYNIPIVGTGDTSTPIPTPTVKSIRMGLYGLSTGQKHIVCKMLDFTTRYFKGLGTTAAIGDVFYQNSSATNIFNGGNKIYKVGGRVYQINSSGVLTQILNC